MIYLISQTLDHWHIKNIMNIYIKKSGWYLNDKLRRKEILTKILID